jgi:TolA-binding protein
MGLDTVVAQANADELAVLGDAARYSRHSDVARAALTALRRRFPRAEQASVAAFLLGRLAETEQDRPAALTWFESYLKERPNGAYASEALGRKMLRARALQGSQATQQLAVEYLQRFPHGTYASVAQQLAP